MKRRDLGLPEKWEAVEDWLDDSPDIQKIVETSVPRVLIKNPEILELESYTSPPPTEFWENFPSDYPKV
jgi:hypothetical protein